MSQLQLTNRGALHNYSGLLRDTDNFELRLLADKLTQLQQTIQHWVVRHTCTGQELESLLGHLFYPATIILQGRVFLRQLFSLLLLNRAPHHFLHLNAGARAELMWWQTFLAWHFVLPSHGYIR